MIDTIKPDNIKDKLILTQDEAAQYLGITKETLIKNFKEGKIPGKRLGYKTFRFHREQLDDFIKSGS